jgi:hypothetical protein
MQKGIFGTWGERYPTGNKIQNTVAVLDTFQSK